MIKNGSASCLQLVNKRDKEMVESRSTHHRGLDGPGSGDFHSESQSSLRSGLNGLNTGKRGDLILLDY